MKDRQRHTLIITLAIAAVGVAGAFGSVASAAPPPPAKNCPAFGWSEGLNGYLAPNAAFPTSDTKNLPTPDCNFHQWSWEAFVWATALINDPGSSTAVPRFMTLATPAHLLAPADNAGEPKLRPLTLAARSETFHGSTGFTEGAGAIVEADGNMLVAPNGYPVYASVHMNKSYFDTAKKNLIATGGYRSQPADSSFSVGAAVFKATWLRLDSDQKPLAGSYTTQAQLPVLETKVTPGLVTIQPVPGKFVTATVALVGLHVVGQTDNHPEFLWGTFEHDMNSPATPDNTFTPSAGRKDPKSDTFYKDGTPFSQVNIAVDPPTLRLDPTSQKITPVTNRKTRPAAKTSRTGWATSLPSTVRPRNRPRLQASAKRLRQLSSGRHGVDAAQFLQSEEQPDQRGRLRGSRECDGRDLRPERRQHADQRRAELLPLPQSDVVFVPEPAARETAEPADRVEPRAVDRHALRSTQLDFGQAVVAAADPRQVVC